MSTVLLSLISAADFHLSIVVGTPLHHPRVNGKQHIFYWGTIKHFQFSGREQSEVMELNGYSFMGRIEFWNMKCTFCWWHPIHMHSFFKRSNQQLLCKLFLLPKEQSYGGFVEVKVPFHMNYLYFIKRKDHYHYIVSQVVLEYRQAFHVWSWTLHGLHSYETEFKIIEREKVKLTSLFSFFLKVQNEPIIYPEKANSATVRST